MIIHRLPRNLLQLLATTNTQSIHPPLKVLEMLQMQLLGWVQEEQNDRPVELPSLR